MVLELTRADKAQIRNLMTSEGWKAIIKSLDQTLTELRKQTITGEDAFQTLRALHLREGGVQSLETFFEDIEREAHV